MLTPAFWIIQDEDFVTVVLKCPYIKVSRTCAHTNAHGEILNQLCMQAQDVEFFISDCEFKFYIKPYFLRLTFPSPILEDGRESASYDVGQGEITVKLPKATKGLVFPDLDLLTKLMAPKGGPPAQATPAAAGDGGPMRTGPLIEMMGDAVSMEAGAGTEEDDEEEDDGDGGDGQDYHWDLPQELPQPVLQTAASYGFNNAHSGYAAHIEEIAHEVLDVKDLDTSTAASRREQRILREDIKFDEEHYMADFLNHEEIQPLSVFRPDFWKALKRVQKARATAPQVTGTQNAAAGPPTSTMSGSEPVEDKHPLPDLGELTLTAPAATTATAEPWLTFTESEQEQMRSLPNKEYLVGDERPLYLGLVDLLFAYAYNTRTTLGEDTVESPWTVAKLSSTLSSFDAFHTLHSVLVACARRALAYPLHRSWEVVRMCVQDVAVLFKLGKRAVVKTLLGVRNLLRGDDRMYVLATVWMDDYCVWVQNASEKKIQSLGSELNHAKLEKADVGWDLEALEVQAKKIPAEGSGEEDAEDEDEPPQELGDRSPEPMLVQATAGPGVQLRDTTSLLRPDDDDGIDTSQSMFMDEDPPARPHITML
ncbi:Hsp90 cochaperone shq1 [Thoreauomyces humboldtii]|nr:Hsp90 cochaperone shq1 [Thoreauomyces humboldtii]